MLGNRLVTLAALVLLACESPGERTAGTSTSVGTNVGGSALTRSGRPAQVVRVTLRARDLVVRDGKPEGRLLAETRADSLGRFAFTVPAERFYLQITCGKECGESEGETWLTAFEDGPKPEALSAIRLEPPGSLRGMLAPAEGNPIPDLWIGIPGTDIYRQPGPKGAEGRPFELSGVPAGGHRLDWVTEARPGVPAVPSLGDSVEVRSGETTDLGTIK